MGKRAFDLFFSAIGIVLLSPVLLVLAVLVKLSDGGSVFFRQIRVGQAGGRFSMLKFRSMVPNAAGLGPGITKDGDPRITGIGRFLRKTKLDELPQLWNVFRGEMSFVGPRPELPVYVAKYTAEQKRVLELRPGITDLATLEFQNEEELLSLAVDGLPTRQSADAVERFYIEYCLPRKIELNLAYANRASVWEDTKLILRTVRALVSRQPAQDTTQRPTLRGVSEVAEKGH